MHSPSTAYVSPKAQRQFGNMIEWANMPAQAKSAIEIHRRLALGEPDDAIARAVGRKPRVIRYHRSWRCVCAVDRPTPVAVELEAGPVVPVGDPVAVATAAYLAGVSPLAIAVALGVDGYALDADALDFGLKGAAISRRRLGRLAAQADALERMRLFRPAQWAKLVAEESESERKMSLDSRLPLETVRGFFSEVVNHQSLILTDDDFRDWIEWVSEMTIARYPTMAG